MTKKRAKPKTAFSQEDIELTQQVKRANQRLRELEQQDLANSPAYKYIERLAFANDPAMAWTKHGEIKFSTNIRSMTEVERAHLRQKVEGFLNAETSTVKGVKKVHDKMVSKYKEATETVKNKDGDIMMTFDLSQVNLHDALDIWNTSIAQQYNKMYGSDLTAIIINTMLEDQMAKEEMEDFLTDQFDNPFSEIMSDLDTQKEFEGTPWSWEDIFKEVTENVQT